MDLFYWRILVCYNDKGRFRIEAPCLVVFVNEEQDPITGMTKNTIKNHTGVSNG
jgi:hypothetical protein